MFCGHMPLYPSLAPGDECVRVPVFGDGRCAATKPPPVCNCRRVTLENPCRPGEWAEVLLGLDEAGNLMIRVRRDPPRGCNCPPGPERFSERPCRHGRGIRPWPGCEPACYRGPEPPCFPEPPCHPEPCCRRTCDERPWPGARGEACRPRRDRWECRMRGD